MSSIRIRASCRNAREQTQFCTEIVWTKLVREVERCSMSDLRASAEETLPLEPNLKILYRDRVAFMSSYLDKLLGCRVLAGTMKRTSQLAVPCSLPVIPSVPFSNARRTGN